MNIFYIIIGIGQLTNLISLIRLIRRERKANPSPGTGYDNALMNLMKNQHNEVVQQQITLRLLGFFLFYGAIWGWIDIVKYFTRKK